MSSGPLWRRCSNCKTEIAFAAVHWVCSVSTCNRKRTGLVFCSTECWDAHLPLMRHREAWAVEERAPASAEQAGHSPARAEQTADPPASAPRPDAAQPRRVLVRSATPAPQRDALADDVLIVASKLKKYVRDRSGMNTSDAVVRVLSDQIRALCDRAIDRARKAERKTVLDRDF